MDKAARRTFAPVVDLRERYRHLAELAFVDQLPENPSPRSNSDLPPLREYLEADWRKALAKAYGEDQEQATTVDHTSFERALLKADLHGRNAERNQTVAIAVNDERVRGWARVDFIPGTCPLCRLTISRGPVYSSKSAAGGESNSYHTGCTCETVLVMQGQTDWPGKSLYEAEKAFYKEHGRNAKAYRKAVREANKATSNESGVTKSTAETVVGTTGKDS